MRRVRFAPGAAVVLLVSLFVSGGVMASASDEVRDKIEEVLTSQIPGLTVHSVSETDLDDFYEVRTDRDTIYMTADGRYALLGDILRFDEAGVVNLSEEGRSRDRAEAIDAVADEDVIAFAPDGEVKAVVAVFTDIDCGYCRQMHRDIEAYNDLGIQINYLAFPRGGPGTPGYTKAVSAWCADDPQDAMTRAKLGENIPEQECDHPVDDQFALGREVGVSGTPALVLEDGRMVPGLRAPEQLAELLGLD